VRAGAALRALHGRLDSEEPRLAEAVLTRLISDPSFAVPLTRKGCLIGLASPEESFFQSLLKARWPAYVTVQPIRLNSIHVSESASPLDLVLVHRPSHPFSRAFIDKARAEQPGLPFGIIGDDAEAQLPGAALKIPLDGIAESLKPLLDSYEPGRAAVIGRPLKGNLLKLPEPGAIGMFRGRHRGQRLFIVASGPSLAEVDSSALDGETVLTVNDAILKFPRARYGAAMDSRKLNELHRELHRTEAVFTLENNTYGVGVKNLGSEGFSANAEEGVYSGYTSTYFALQIALFMGFGEICILGLDLAAAPDRSHFFGLRPLQDRDRPEVYLQMQRSFERAAPLIGQMGVKLYNCSPVSRLKAFPFRPLEELLQLPVARRPGDPKPEILRQRGV
jgi:hypothetical protein